MKKQIGLLVAGGVILAAATLFLYWPAGHEAVPFPGDSIRVAVPLTYLQDHRVLVDAEVVNADALQERIRKTVKTTGHTGVLLTGERGLGTHEITKVMDVLTSSGVIDRIQLAHPD